MTRFYLDLETRSEIDLRASGHHAYAEHPSTAVLLLGYAFDAEPPALWQPHLGPLPAAVRQALADPAITKVAHNAAFELAILRHVLGIESALEAWRCTAVMGRLNGLPGGLADLGRALGLGAGQAKLASGTRLIHKFSRPQARGPRWRTWETDPEDWRALGEYCLRDVEAERAVYERLAPWMPPAAEWALWRLDQAINQRGLPVDRTLVEAAIQIDADFRARALERAVALTGLSNPNSRDQLLEWLNREGEAGLADLRAGSVREAIAQCGDASVREVLQIRQALAKTSVRKYQALARATSADGRLRGAFLFAGASRTGRFSGQGVQVHNLPRGSLKDLDTAVSAVQGADAEWVEALYGDVPAVLSACVRPAICAPEGQVLVAADYSSIESVVVAWLAESRYLLALFETGRDPYKDFATRIFHVDYDAVTKLQRTFSKPAVLGCLVGETPVLTDRGWVPLREVALADRLWDGTAWVAHGGLIDQGVRPVRTWLGVRITPDHLVFTEDDQCHAADACIRQPFLAQSALAWASSRLPAGCSARPERSYATSRSARAEGRAARCGQTSTTDTQPAARAAVAQPSSAPARNGPTSSPTGGSGCPGPIAMRRWWPVAIIWGMSAIATTVREAFRWCPSGTTAACSFSGWPLSPTTRISPWSWIGATTTGPTPRGTADWWTGAPTPATDAATATSFFGESGSRCVSFVTAMRRRIATCLRSVASWSGGPRWRRSSPTRCAAAVPTFDVLNAGPRHRYTILTAAGPLLVHNCAYGLGGPGLQRYAASMGVTLSEAEARTHIATYREAYADVPALWRRLTAGAELALRERTSFAVGRLAWEYEKPFLFLRLPSGRRLGYYQPKLEQRDTPWGEQRITLTYEGQAQTTRKWGRIPTHAGKVVENCLAADTEVLTDRGWVPIVEVRATDRLWDGEAWVAHAGVLCQGERDTIERLGIRATPDHPVLTPDGWVAFVAVERIEAVSEVFTRRTFLRAEAVGEGFTGRTFVPAEGRDGIGEAA